MFPPKFNSASEEKVKRCPKNLLDLFGENYQFHFDSIHYVKIHSISQVGVDINKNLALGSSGNPLYSTLAFYEGPFILILISVSRFRRFIALSRLIVIRLITQPKKTGFRDEKN